MPSNKEPGHGVPKRQPRPEAITTARWWADHLRKPSSGRDPRVTAAIRSGGIQKIRKAIKDASVFEALRAAERRDADLTEVRIRAFERYLAEAIELELIVDEHHCTIHNDWEPDELLVRAAHRAGFDAGLAIFPVKSLTITRPGEVYARLGESGSGRRLPIIHT